MVTGHRRDGEPEPNWAGLAQSVDTVVVLMGVSERGRIATALQSGGLAGSTPAAAVQSATTGTQVCWRGRLDELAAAPVRSPAVLVIGAVAAFDLRSLSAVAASVSPPKDLVEFGD